MNEVNNISLEQAAIAYTPYARKSDKAAQHMQYAFKAGAQWQKEQLKHLLGLIKDGTDELKINGAVNVANRIENEIERLNLL